MPGHLKMAPQAKLEGQSGDKSGHSTVRDACRSSRFTSQGFQEVVRLKRGFLKRYRPPRKFSKMPVEGLVTPLQGMFFLVRRARDHV